MKKLLILSGKGGTGKTTTAAALIHFAKAEAFADCDVDAPNLHLVTKALEERVPETTDFYGSKKSTIDAEKCINCGLCQQHCRFNAIKQINAQYTISTYHCEGCGVCEYVCPNGAITMQDDISGRLTLYRGVPTFSTAKLKMGRGNSGKLVTAVKTGLTNAYISPELAIIDGSPGIGCPVIASMSGVDLVLIVAEPSLSGISDMERIIKTAAIFQTPVAICVNKYDTSLENTEKIKDFCQQNKLDFVGQIPYDKQASIAINEGKTLAEVGCQASNALYEIYERVIALLVNN